MAGKGNGKGFGARKSRASRRLPYGGAEMASGRSVKEKGRDGSLEAVEKAKNGGEWAGI